MNMQQIRRAVSRGFRAHEAAFNAVARRDQGPDARQIVGDRVCAGQDVLAALLELNSGLELRQRLLSAGWNAFCTLDSNRIMVIHANTPIPKGYRCVAKQLRAVIVDRSKLRIIVEDESAEKQDAADELGRLVISNRVSVSATDLNIASRKTLGALTHVGLDRTYTAVARATLVEALRVNRVSEDPYIAEDYDCDDFAIALKAGLARVGMTAVGIVIDYSGEHAYNAVGITTGDGVHVELVEPQSDLFVVAGQGEYAAKAGYVVW